MEKPNSTSIYTDFRDLSALGGFHSPASDDGKKQTSFVSITVGIGGIDNNSQYAYESAGGSRIFVLEKMLESKYCYAVPCQVSLKDFIFCICQNSGSEIQLSQDIILIGY
jgi:hypothetical protein